MRCKVFDCRIEELEGLIHQWITETEGLHILRVTPLGLTVGTFYHDEAQDIQWGQKMAVLIFYKESIKVDQPDVPEGELPKCPKCGRPMRVRANSSSGNLFFGCPGFPECTGTKQFTPEDEVRFGGGLPPDGSLPGPSSGLPPDDDDIPF